jgi:integrase/recombinase XerD
MATAVLTINRSKKDKNGTVPVYLKVRQGGKEASMFTGFRIPLKDWNKKGHEVRKSHRDHHQINTRLSELKHQALSAVNSLIARGLEPTPLKVIEAVKTPVKSKTGSFLAFFDAELKRYEREGSFNTVESYGVARRHFEEFLNAECNGLHPSFQDLTLDLLTRFRTHLISVRVNSETTIHKKLSALRTVYRSAQKRELVSRDKNPFEYLEMRKDTAEKPSLSMTEIAKLADLDLPRETLSLSRDIFLFSFLGGGLRISDALRMRRKHLVQSGQNWRLVFRPKKTGKALFQATLSSVAIEILERYGFPQSSPEERLFPLMASDIIEKTHREHLAIKSGTALQNKRLLQIGELAELPIRLTSHVVRHSVVRALNEKRATVPDIQKVVGHSQLRSTQIYLQSIPDAHIDELMSDLGSILPIDDST